MSYDVAVYSVCVYVNRVHVVKSCIFETLQPNWLWPTFPVISFTKNILCVVRYWFSRNCVYLERVCFDVFESCKHDREL